VTKTLFRKTVNSEKVRKPKKPAKPSRLRLEIVEMTKDQHGLGLVSDDELTKTTMRMLGRDALPPMTPLSASDIAAVREEAGVSQAVMAAFLNVGVGTVSQWERGTRRPTGTALKLLHVVRAKGLAVLG
jgi:putative transcriptional regulator